MPVDINIVEDLGPFQYGRLEQEGLLWRAWLEFPDEFPACIVTPCTLTIRDLWEDGWLIAHDVDPEVFYDGIPADYVTSSRVLDATTATRHFLPRHIVDEVGHPPGVLSEEQVYKYIVLKKQAGHGGEENAYYLIIGPGVIFAIDIKRTDGPHWSEIALAAYRQYETEELKFVFQFEVVNYVTVRFITEVLYNRPDCLVDGTRANRNIVVWGPDLNEPEYHALLATPNIRGSVALLLGGFVRGTMHIPHIITWSGHDSKLNICIFIAPLPEE